MKEKLEKIGRTLTDDRVEHVTTKNCESTESDVSRRERLHLRRTMARNDELAVLKTDRRIMRVFDVEAVEAEQSF